MPLILNKNIHPHYRIMVWGISHEEEKKSIEYQRDECLPKHPIKQLEYIFSRHLVHLISQSFDIQNQHIFKTPTGQPSLEKASLSISHAYPFVAVGIHTQKHPIGIDIDFPKKKHLKIKERVFSPTELAYIQNNILFACELWIGKECIYKCLDLRLSFKNHIQMSKNSTNPTKTIRNKYNFTVDGFQSLDISSKNQERFNIEVGYQTVIFEGQTALLGFTIPLDY